MVVGSVVHHWISLMVDDLAVNQDGLGHVVGRILGRFYKDSGVVLIQMFRMIGLVAIVAKSKTFDWVCHRRSFTEHNRGGMYLSGMSDYTRAMRRMWGGYDGCLHETPPLADTWYEAGD